MCNPFDYESGHTLSCKNITERLDRLGKAKTEREIFSSGIYGLFGSGKTNFLESYFSPERCRALAEGEGRQLYPKVMPTRSPKSEELFADIYEAIRAYIEKYVPRGALPSFPKLGKDIADSTEKLKAMAQKIREGGYHLFLVIDEFHRISQCETIREDDYEEFRQLKENSEIKMQYVVATDCDFDPQNTSHTTPFTTSFFVHAFDGNSETVGGMSRTEMDAFLAGFLEEGAEPVFTKEETDMLYALTGGLPHITRKTAQVLYEYKDSNMTEEELRAKAGAAVQDQFECWCESLTMAQKALLRKMVTEGFSKIYQKKENRPYNGLVNRGFVLEGNEKSKDRNVDTKRFCCELFADYVQESFEEEYAAVYGASPEVRLDPEGQQECLQEARRVREMIVQKLKELEEKQGITVKITIRTFKKLESELRKIVEELGDRQYDAEMIVEYTRQVEAIRREYKGRMIWK